MESRGGGGELAAALVSAWGRSHSEQGGAAQQDPCASDWCSHLAVSGPWFLFLLCERGWQCHSFIAHPAESLFEGWTEPVTVGTTKISVGEAF